MRNVVFITLLLMSSVGFAQQGELVVLEGLNLSEVKKVLSEDKGVEKFEIDGNTLKFTLNRSQYNWFSSKRVSHPTRIAVDLTLDFLDETKCNVIISALRYYNIGDKNKKHTWKEVNLKHPGGDNINLNKFYTYLEEEVL
ncbi:MAG: hypothetical protein ACPGRE_02820 [Flavobacteriaceae bacterium]